MYNILKYNIDLQKADTNPPKVVQQYDDLEFQITIRNNDSYYDLTNVGCEFVFVAANNAIDDNVEISKAKNHIIIKMKTNNCTKSYGGAKFQLTLISDGGQRSTYPFYIDVNKSILEGLGESQTIISAIDELKDYLNSLNLSKLGDDWFHIVKKEDWIYNKKDNIFEYTVNHNLDSTNVIYNAISLETNELLLLGGNIIDNNNIKFETGIEENMKIIIMARHMASVVTGTYDNEIVDARMGKATLHEKISEIINMIESDSDYGVF